MHFTLILLTTILLINADQTSDCDIKSKSSINKQKYDDEKFIFYDVNPPEGFNLRRDVYMRFAIMLANAHRAGKRLEWRLVLPPWYRLYHWRSQNSSIKPEPWSTFFDVKSLKSFATVVELHEIFSETKSKSLEIDILYILQNYNDPFEGGTFKEKWELSKDGCYYDGQFWGYHQYNNITAKEILCVKFQGSISKLWELASLHSSNKKIMFFHGEIPLHDNYGTKTFWDCRKSMRFNHKLEETAEKFKEKYLDCKKSQCTTYLSVHWRRQDFTLGRRKDVPSITGTASQINDIVKKLVPNITKIFVATDASQDEFKELKILLEKHKYKVYTYVPKNLQMGKYKDGEIAIIDQIICSHAMVFVGTHESTFTFRIQEEREILGFISNTTFNRLCSDAGECEQPSKWTIVH